MYFIKLIEMYKNVCDRSNIEPLLLKYFLLDDQVSFKNFGFKVCYNRNKISESTESG